MPAPQGRGERCEKGKLPPGFRRPEVERRRGMVRCGRAAVRYRPAAVRCRPAAVRCRRGVLLSFLRWRRRDGVDDGLGFLELGDGQGTAQAADAALLVTALGEAVVDRGPGVRPDRADLDLAADPPAG